MLARVASSLSRKAVPAKKGKISTRRYTTLYRDPNQQTWIPKTDALEKALNAPKGGQTVVEAYKQLVEKEKSLRDQALAELQAASPNVTFNSARAVIQSVTEAVASLQTPEVSIVGKAFELGDLDHIDAVLETHEAGKLAATYIKAIKNITYTPTTVDLPVQPIAEAVAPYVAALRAAEESVKQMSADQEARYQAACKNATDLLYVKADEILAARPDLEAQFEEEIKENRWDLMFQEN